MHVEKIDIYENNNCNIVSYNFFLISVNFHEIVEWDRSIVADYTYANNIVTKKMLRKIFTIDLDLLFAFFTLQCG